MGGATAAGKRTSWHLCIDVLSTDRKGNHTHDKAVKVGAGRVGARQGRAVRGEAGRGVAHVLSAGNSCSRVVVLSFIVCCSASCRHLRLPACHSSPGSPKSAVPTTTTTTITVMEHELYWPHCNCQLPVVVSNMHSATGV